MLCEFQSSLVTVISQLNVPMSVLYSQGLYFRFSSHDGSHPDNRCLVLPLLPSPAGHGCLSSAVGTSGGISVAEVLEQLAPWSAASSSCCVTGRLELAEKNDEIFFCLLLGSSVALFCDIILIVKLVSNAEKVTCPRIPHDHRM